MLKSFGPMARRVNQRIIELSVADNLAIMRTIPAAGCHELTGDRWGELAVEVSGNYRIIFEPDHDPFPRQKDGGLNWEEVKRIRINGVEDYH